MRHPSLSAPVLLATAAALLALPGVAGANDTATSHDTTAGTATAATPAATDANGARDEAWHGPSTAEGTRPHATTQEKARLKAAKKGTGASRVHAERQEHMPVEKTGQ